jgi:hypothetical protein
MTALLLPLRLVAGTALDTVPDPHDVKAGWTAFVIFLLLVAAVVVLAFSFVKQLRKAQAAKDAGLYGDPPKSDAGAEGPEDAASGDAWGGA